MKSERRHELETNELADWLGHATERVQPYLKTILAGVLVAVLVLAGRALMAGNSQKQRDESWTALFGSMKLRDPDAVRDVAKLYPRTTAAPWAYQTAGDLGLEKGANQLLMDREAGKKFLLAAADDYQSAFRSAKDDMLRQKALLGLAQVHEALGDVAKAKEQYQKIATTWPNEPVAELANRRGEFAGRKDTADFLAWFATQKIEPNPPANQAGPKPPSIYDDLPTSEDLKLPDLEDLKRTLNMEISPPAATNETPPTSPESTPSSTESAPDAAEPAGTDPSDIAPSSTETESTDSTTSDTPATETSPAESPPAEAPPATDSSAASTESNESSDVTNSDTESPAGDGSTSPDSSPTEPDSDPVPPAEGTTPTP